MFSYCSCFSLDLILDDFWLSYKLNPISNHENLSLKIVIQSRCCKFQGQKSKRNSKCVLSNGDTSRTSLQALKVTGWEGRAPRQPKSLSDRKPAPFRSCASAFSPSSLPPESTSLQGQGRMMVKERLCTFQAAWVQILPLTFARCTTKVRASYQSYLTYNN